MCRPSVTQKFRDIEGTATPGRLGDADVDADAGVASTPASACPAAVAAAPPRDVPPALPRDGGAVEGCGRACGKRATADTSRAIVRRSVWCAGWGRGRGRGGMLSSKKTKTTTTTKKTKKRGTLFCNGVLVPSRQKRAPPPLRAVSPKIQSCNRFARCPPPPPPRSRYLIVHTWASSTALSCALVLGSSSKKNAKHTCRDRRTVTRSGGPCSCV